MTASRQQEWDKLRDKIKTLNETVWDQRAQWPSVERWLSQFQTDVDPDRDEQLQALFVLSHFMFFGFPEIRALLRSVFRDFFRQGLVQQIRRENGDTLDRTLIEAGVRKELSSTRFVSLGNPSESSAMLLYFFRQENKLPKSLFANAIQLLDTSGTTVGVRSPKLDHYVFLDDLCGSGQQGEEYAKHVVAPIKQGSKAKAYYFALFGCSAGLERIRQTKLFDVVEAVVELDPSFKCFEPESRVFSGSNMAVNREATRATFEKYGKILWADYPLGYEDSQLILAFEHNTPDNTLPAFWWEGEAHSPWYPLFKRYGKW